MNGLSSLCSSLSGSKRQFSEGTSSWLQDSPRSRAATNPKQRQISSSVNSHLNVRGEEFTSSPSEPHLNFAQAFHQMDMWDKPRGTFHLARRLISRWKLQAPGPDVSVIFVLHRVKDTPACIQMQGLGPTLHFLYSVTTPMHKEMSMWWWNVAQTSSIVQQFSHKRF